MGLFDGLFDNFFDGRWSESSSCGFDQDCHRTKDCIFRVCSPNRDLYGGVLYDSCVNYCNQDSSAQSIQEMICDNPENALKVYGYRCSGYNGKQGIFAVTPLQWFLLLFTVLVVYLVLKKYE